MDLLEDRSTTNIPPYALEDLEELWQQGQAQRDAREEARKTPPLIRLWDGDWKYVGTVHDALEASFQWKLNDTGTGYMELPAHSHLAQWVMDYPGRDARNVHVTMDKDGARWGGRLKTATVAKRKNGAQVLELHFLHEYEELKHIYVWPNPFLPAAVQFPRAFTLVGPTAWVLKTALFLNVRRLAGHTWALPDDPFDIHQWGGQWRPSTWPIQVAPSQAILSDTSPWTVISSRMKNWHDMAAPKLADAQLMVTTRRYLDGDDDPWPGANLNHGALIIDIVDKSGYWSTRGTATHGDIWKGMVRTVQEVVNDVVDGVTTIDTHSTVMDEPVDPPEYHWTNFLSTSPDAPYVVYRDGPVTGVESSEFTWEPAMDVQVVVGGKSMYGVNEAISTAVTLVGNYLGSILFAFSGGTILDKFLQPIYADTLLAWQSAKSILRAQELGWSKYYEHFSDGADGAYSLSSIMALRKGFWDTREKISHKLQVQDGAPWYVGDNGKGHFFLGDRIGATIAGLPEGRIVVEQVTELTYNFSRTERGWEITCGDQASQRDPLEQILDRVREAMSAIHELGVNPS